MALDEKRNGPDKGVWKSGKGKGRRHTKGRQLDDTAWAEVRELLGAEPRDRDLLIEHLHLIQDKFGHLSAAHLRALAEEMRLSMAEVYEVATFYAHFDVVKEGETPPPALTIRVCDSLSCEMAGAQALKSALEEGLDPSEVRVLRAPCMGRCDTAPVLELGHAHIDNATPEKVHAAIAAGETHATIPAYETYTDYVAAGAMPNSPICARTAIGRPSKKKFTLPGCAVWAGRVSRLAKNGVLCAPMQVCGILLSTEMKGNLVHSRTAITLNARPTCFLRVC